MNNTKKNSYLITGEPGVGKSFFIRCEAKRHNAKLFRWNVRIDRSLREGREVLHQQVRSKEPLYVWIEGADDLTQEAQAFLRRILETSSSSVVSMLEVREPWKLSPPILSRCVPINITHNKSYRLQHNMAIAKSLNLNIDDIPLDIKSIRLSHIPDLRKNGYDPIKIIYSLANLYNYDSNSTTILKKVGAGYSSWIQLAYFLALIQQTKDTII